MKHLLSIVIAALMGWSPILAQKKNEDKKVHVKVEQESNGKTIKVDSVFNSKAEADAYLKSKGLDVPPPPPPPPAPRAPGAPVPPVPPTAPHTKNVKKKIIIQSENGTDDEKHLSYSYSFDDESLDSIIEMSMDKVMAFEMPDFEHGFHFESNHDGEREMIIRRSEKQENCYRLEFRLEEPGTAKITVQGKDGKMLYEESLEGVKGNFHRDFDLEKYAGATLQLNVQSGKSKQTRKMVL